MLEADEKNEREVDMHELAELERVSCTGIIDELGYVMVHPGKPQELFFELNNDLLERVEQLFKNAAVWSVYASVISAALIGASYVTIVGYWYPVSLLPLLIGFVWVFIILYLLQYKHRMGILIVSLISIVWMVTSAVSSLDLLFHAELTLGFLVGIFGYCIQFVFQALMTYYGFRCWKLMPLNNYEYAAVPGGP